MITPIMVALICEALASVPNSWREGAVALGVNRWRAIWRVTLRAARPAIVAAAVLATARALGEAIMLSMVSGSSASRPTRSTALTFFFEPLRTLAVDDRRLPRGDRRAGARISALRVRAAAAVLGARAVVRRLGLIKLPLRKYQVRRDERAALTDEARRARGRCASGRGRRSSPLTLALDRSLALAWRGRAGIALCLIAAAIVALHGLSAASQYLRPSLLFSRPPVGARPEQSTGGFLDPLLGTALLTLIGIAARRCRSRVAAALWIVEYGRPRGSRGSSSRASRSSPGRPTS